MRARLLRHNGCVMLADQPRPPKTDDVPDATTNFLSAPETASVRTRRESEASPPSTPVSLAAGEKDRVVAQAGQDVSNLLNSLNLPVLMLGSDLTIRYFTPQTQRMMHLRASDIGRPFSDIRVNLRVDNLEPLFAEVLGTLGSRELDVQDNDGRWHLLRVRPYRAANNKVEGLVVVLVDIDQLRRVHEEIRDAQDFASSIVQGVRLPLVVVDADFAIRLANHAFGVLVGQDSDTLEHRALPEVSTVLLGIDQLLRNHSAQHTFTFEHRVSEDGARVFSVSGRALQDGGRFVLLTFEDVSAQREVEHLLQAENQRLTSELDLARRELDRSRDELRALNRSLLTSQEEERRRIGRELHDDIGQRLASMNMTLERMRAKGNRQDRSELQTVVQDMEQLASDVRSLSHRLHPAVLEHLGLRAALRALTEEFGAREGMIATFFASEWVPELPIETSTGLYRIAQEALRNVAKHAGKTHAKISLVASEDVLELQVADAGHGFDMERIPSGLGLISMRERASFIGGVMTVQSALREGTRVRVTVPITPPVD